MPTIDTPEGSLFYTDDGAGGPVLLLVHGWACDSHDWAAQVGPLAARHRVIVPDLRGHGRSGTPPRGFAPTDFAADLAALVTALGVAPVVAVGHSMGGIVVSVLAAELPALVQGVVVLDPPYGLDEAAGADARAFAAEVRRDGSHAPILARLGVGGPVSVLTANEVWRRRRALGVPFDVLAEAVVAVHEGDEPLAELTATRRLLAARRAPTLAIHADPARAAWEEGLLDDERSAAAAVPGASHWLHQDEPERVNRLILDWVGALSAVRA